MVTLAFFEKLSSGKLHSLHHGRNVFGDVGEYRAESQLHVGTAAFSERIRSPRMAQQKDLALARVRDQEVGDLDGVAPIRSIVSLAHPAAPFMPNVRPLRVLSADEMHTALRQAGTAPSIAPKSPDQDRA